MTNSELALIMPFLLSGCAVYAIGFARLLPARHPWLLGLTVFCALLFLNTVADRYLNAFYAVLFMVATTLIAPFILFEGSASNRIIAIALANASLALSELVAETLWSVFAGITVPENMRAYNDAIADHLLEYAIASLVSFGVLWAALVFSRRLIRGHVFEVGPRTALLYLAFPFAQFILISLILLIDAMVDIDAETLIAQVVLIVMCIAADVLLVVSMELHNRKEREDARAHALQQQLDEHLERLEPITGEIDQISRIRHDYRNQTHVALALFELGKVEDARSHLTTYRISLEEDAECA